MTMRRIDPTLYTQAADAFDAVASSADSVGSSARGSAGGYGSMAGSDPGGEQFASAYDEVAGYALQNIFDIGIRANSLDRLFMASGANAASAEATASGQPFDSGTFTLRPARQSQSVASPPSAFGGNAGEPKGWEIVTDVVGMMWPNADTDQLDEAAQTWKDIARDVRRLATEVRQADNAVASLDSIELAKARTEVNDFASDIGEVAQLIEDMGTQCAEYADDVREAHKEVIEMLVQLAVEIAATVAISAALSAFTFGASAAAGAAAMTARIAVIGGRIITILTRVGGTAARVAVRIRAIRASLIPFALRHQRSVRAVINIASGTAAAVTAEVIVKRGDANLLVAFGSGLVGGGVTEAIVAPFGRYGQRVLVQTLAGGGGGAAGGVTDGLISDGSVDIRQVVISGIGGAGFSGWGARGGSGRGGSASAADPGAGDVRVDEPVPVITGGNNAEAGGPDGGRTGNNDYEGPVVSGGNDVSSGGGDGGPAGSTDYDGPNVTGGNDVSGSGGDSGPAPQVPQGEAPNATGGNDPGGGSGSGNGSGSGPRTPDPVDIPTPPVHTGGGDGTTPTHGGDDTPIFHDTEGDLGVDADGDGHAGLPPAPHGAGTTPQGADTTPQGPDTTPQGPDSTPTPGDDAVPPVGADGDGADADAPVGADGDGADAPVGQPEAGDSGTSPADPAEADPATDPASPAAPHQPQPDHTGPMYSNEASGDGWNRYGDTGQNDPHYGEPRPDHGTVPAHYQAPESPNPDIAPMIGDPDAPFGRDADGTPLPDQDAWNERYALPDNADGSPGGPRWPTNDGAVPGSRVHYHGVDALLRDYPQFANLDRIGRTSGDYLTVANTPFEQRGLTPGHQGMDLLHRQLAPDLPPGIRIEVSVIDDALGYPGGGWQIRFFRAGPDGRPRVGENGRDEFLSVNELDLLGVFL